MPEKKRSKAKSIARPIVLEVGSTLTDLFLTVAGKIPIASALKIGVDSIQNIRNRFYARKLEVFFLQTKEFTDKEKLKLLQLSDELYFFESLWLSIDRLHDLEKAEILARLFKNMVIELLDRDTFKRLIYPIENIYLDDLKRFKKDFGTDELARDNFLRNYYSSEDRKDPYYSILVANGFILQKENSVPIPNPIRFEITSLGQAFIDHAF